jgi:phosphoglycolate phosphatase
VQKRFDLIMFDLDGTLVETAPEIGDAVNDTLRRFSLTEVTQDMVERWIGHGTHELLIQAVAHAGKSTVSAVRHSDSLKLIYSEFQKNYETRCGSRSQLYPQVRMVLERLRAAGTRLAVVTNKEKRYTDRVLSAHQLDGFFDKVVCGDTFQTKKPNPQGVRHCLALYGLAPAQALFVGDSSIDIETAKNAGVAVWAVPYGYNMGQPIESSKPDRLIADFLPLLGEVAPV